MNKLNYLQIVDELDFDKNHYCIISGGVMLMYGLRETEDVDLRITNLLFNKIKGEYDLKVSSKYPNLYELFDNIELSVSDFNREDVVFVEGYPVETLEKTKEWKLKHKREKDVRDLALIDEYLKENK